MSTETGSARAVRGYWQTVYSATFEPRRFFAEPIASRSRVRPIVFLLLTQLIALPIGSLVFGLLTQPDPGVAVFTALFVAVVGPLLVLPGVLLQTLLLHGAARLFGSRTARLADTFATVCMASAPALLALTLPVVGHPIAAIWGLVVLSIALSRTHGLSGARGFFAVISGPAVAVSLALLVRTFVVEAYKIPAGSMIPSLQVGDHIFVNKYVYRSTSPARGEIIVFRFPKDPSKDFIKRVVAVAGDTVEIRDNVVWVNGAPLPRRPIEGSCEYEDYDEVASRWEMRPCEAFEEIAAARTYRTVQERGATPRSWPAITVPPGSVWVLGDNRDNSHDSRFWGFVPLELIKGRAAMIWYSSDAEGMRPDRIGQSL